MSIPNDNPDDKFMSNQNVNAKYEYDISPIGKGSFASVYLGQDKNKRQVAIKKINITKISIKLLHKFNIEMEIVKTFNHINIVKTIETFKTINNIYVVMEYCNNNTLFEYIKENYKYTSDKEKNVLKIISQIKNAFEYLYELNIFHRDLKPKNILIHKTSEVTSTVKIADFGFAKIYDRDFFSDDGYCELENTFCGTPLYMAPEVLINNKFNIKCDLWSIGVIFYEMLYGYVPYDKPRNINELKKMIETQHISFPSNYSENVIMFFPYNYSEKVIILVKSLLQYDPLKRIDWIDFFDNDIFKNPEKKISSPINIPNNLNINKSNYIDKDGEEMYKDYIVINQQEIEKLKTYYSYKEESSSIIKILSESYNYLFGTSPKSI
jgi:serine/threonine-protein kinase ULK/ATG1